MPNLHGSDQPGRPHPPRPSTRGDRKSRSSSNDFSLIRCVGEGIPLLGGHRVRLSIGWSWPALVLVVMLGAWLLRGQPANGDLPAVAVALLMFAGLGSLFQAACFVLLRPVRGRAAVVLTAAGIREPQPPKSRSGVWSRWIQLALGPLVQLKLGIFAAVVGLVWNASRTVVADGLFSFSGRTPLQIAAAVWMVQALVTLAPLPGTQGKAILRATLNALLSRQSWQFRERLARRLEGLIAVGCVALGLAFWQIESPDGFLPLWPCWICLGVVVWISRAALPAVAPADWDSSAPPASPRPETSPLLRWWNRHRVRRAFKNEHGEAWEAARADAILDKLHRQGRDALTHRERSLLRRVSERIRQTRDQR
jgi:hypothetical protein